MIPKEYIPTIKRTPMFSGMEESEVEQMLQCMNAAPYKFKKDQYILNAGEKVSHVCILLEGEAHILRDDIFGNRTVLSQILPGGIFGETFACGDVGILPVSVLPIADSTVLFLNYKKVIETCTSSCAFHHRLIENMLRILAGKNLTLNSKIEVLSAKTTREKIMVFLMSWVDTSCRSPSSAPNVSSEGKAPQEFLVPFNRQQMADYLCVDRSAMSSELGRMRDEGILTFHKNRFRLLQPLSF